MKLKNLKVEQFKGCESAVYDFSDTVQIIKGKNGSGKSTIADAYYYLFTDKDYALNANPEIHNTGLAESEPSVTAVCDVNGKEVTFRKYQADMRTKKQKMAGAPFRISNKYEINDVPVTQKDFLNTLDSFGVDVENFLLLSHTGIATSMKNADLRKLLFGMVSDVTDEDVARSTEGCEDVAPILAESTMEEITARAKKSIKGANEQLTALPNQIIGMEKAKVPVNPELPKQKEEAEKAIYALTEEREAVVKALDVSGIDAQIAELNAQAVKRYQDANAERLKKLSDAQTERNKAEAEYADTKNSLNWLGVKGEGVNSRFLDAKKALETEKNRLKITKKLKFTGKTVCPTCGQPLQKDKVNEAKSHFEEEKQGRLDEINANIEKLTASLSAIKDEGKKLTDEKKVVTENVSKAKAILDAAIASVEAYALPVSADRSDIDAQIAELNQKKEKVSDRRIRLDEIDAQIALERAKVHDIIKAQAAETNNAFIDEQIADMKEQQKTYAQVKADAEKVLYQLSLVSARKNEVLSEQVNSHFTRVRFRLFKTQKNGEVVDDCTPMVLCSDGEYRDMVYSANTAAVVAAKIDICSGLQKYFKQDLPIWVDGAECLDDANRREIKTDSQLILLCVSEDEGLVFE